MSFTGILPDGAGTFESTHRFIDADNADPKGVFKNAAGEVVAEISWKQTRRKADEKIPDVDQVIAKYLEVSGGLEANLKMKSRRIEGTIALFGSEEPAKLTVIQKAPNLILTTIDGEEFTAREGSDGKTVWKSNPTEGTVELQGVEKAQKMRDNRFHKYLDLKKDYQTLVSKGRKTVDGKSYDVLLATLEDGGSETPLFRCPNPLPLHH